MRWPPHESANRPPQDRRPQDRPPQDRRPQDRPPQEQAEKSQPTRPSTPCSPWPSALFSAGSGGDGVS